MGQKKIRVSYKAPPKVGVVNIHTGFIHLSRFPLLPLRIFKPAELSVTFEMEKDQHSFGSKGNQREVVIRMGPALCREVPNFDVFRQRVAERGGRTAIRKPLNTGWWTSIPECPPKGPSDSLSFIPKITTNMLLSLKNVLLFNPCQKGWALQAVVCVCVCFSGSPNMGCFFNGNQRGATYFWACLKKTEPNKDTLTSPADEFDLSQTPDSECVYFSSFSVAFRLRPLRHSNPKEELTSRHKGGQPLTTGCWTSISIHHMVPMDS